MTTSYYMSEKQKAFIERLLRERFMTEEFHERTQAYYEDFSANALSMHDASTFIGMLLQCQPLPRVVEPSANEVTEDGMYKLPDGSAIYKVQFNKATGDGRRLYAKKLVIVDDPLYDEDGGLLKAAKVGFEYESGAIRRLRPEYKMTLEEAREFGVLYGTCCVCGRTLTDETSIEAGIGPICAGRFER